jgi:hypothetical protein
VAALASLLAKDAEASPALTGLPHFAPKAKRVIYLFQHGAPSQLDLFDYKPKLQESRGVDLPDSVRKGQRLTGMTAYQATFPTAPSIFKFAQHGQSGAWLSELLPHTAKMADRICIIRSMQTEAINHDPAVTFFPDRLSDCRPPQHRVVDLLWTGQREPGSSGVRGDGVAGIVECAGAGGSPVGQRFSADQLSGRQVSLRRRSGVIPFRPSRLHTAARRRFLDDLAKLNQVQLKEYQDPEIATRIAQYELAYKMQSSVPELADLSKEPESTFEMYGPDSRKPGSYAANCILARRLAERGVRFIQLFHRGWDQHGNLPRDLAFQCQHTDQPSAALIQDLQQRGMLDDTLVGMGRRIRAHSLLAGRADGNQLRSRPSSALLQPMDGRRRRQRRRNLWRDRRLQLQHRE